jgi:hypothetical protein
MSEYSFDKNFYIKAYKDVNIKFVNPYTHFIKFGAITNRLPCKKKFTDLYPLFDISAYYMYNSDLKHFTEDEIIQHFHHRGRFECRQYIK